MTEVFGKITVNAPYSVAMDAIVRRLRTSKNTLALVVPFRKLGIGTNLGVERDVMVAFVPMRGAKGAQQLHDEVEFTWEPTGGGPFPTFCGTLRMHPEGSRTELVLSGEYQPPGGKLGDAFDAVIGKRVAEATAQTLLERLKDDLESDFAAIKATIEETQHTE